jgi:hypothetical protein
MAQNHTEASVFQLFSFNLFLKKKVAKIQENLTLQPTSANAPSQNFPASALPAFWLVKGSATNMF